MTATSDDQASGEAAIRAQVREVLLDLAPIKDPPDKPRLELENDLGYDSLALLEAVVTLEEELGLMLTDGGSLTSIKTVTDVCDYVVQLARHIDA